MVRMTRFYDDPTLEELLGDSMTQAIMKADRVDRPKLEMMLRSVAREIDRGRGGAAMALVDDGAPSDGSAAGRLLPPTAMFQDNAPSRALGSRIRSRLLGRLEP
jgi:hypothetical protein